MHFRLIYLLLYLTLGVLESKQTICLNMIVKNENSIIEKSLSSAKKIIDYWVIVDTGSTDGTQETIREFMKDIPGELHERPWVDFAHNRNEALELARGKSDYILIMDADEEYIFEPGFQMPKLTCDGYHLDFRMPDGLMQFQRLWMIKGDANWKWEGVLHEALVNPEPHTLGILEGFHGLLSGAVSFRSTDTEKWKKDAKVLESALEKDPNNSRYTFYLAQSYLNAKEYEKALAQYERRVGMGGFEEEAFISRFGIALLKNTIHENSGVFINDLIQAFLSRPSRAEPLHRLANVFIRSKNYFLGYLVAKFGAEIPLSKDALFVERWIYDWGLLHQQAYCAAQLGRDDESYKLFYRLSKNSAIPQHIKEELEKNFDTIRSLQSSKE